MTKRRTRSTIGAYEAKTHLPRLLDDVAAGQTITITKHGRPVAILVPPGAADRLEAAVVIAALRQARRHVRLDGLSVRRLIEEGRR